MHPSGLLYGMTPYPDLLHRMLVSRVLGLYPQFRLEKPWKSQVNAQAAPWDWWFYTSFLPRILDGYFLWHTQSTLPAHFSRLHGRKVQEKNPCCFSWQALSLAHG